MKKLLTSSLPQAKIVGEAVKVLKKGGVIALPTETAYGLGADFFNLKAIKKVYEIKNRASAKPLPILVSSFRMAREVVKLDQVALRLAKKYWPGPLTLVLEVARNNSQDTNKFQLPTSNFQTLGLRISSNKLATSIVRKFGQPITITSANRAGQKTCYTAEDVVKQFTNKKHQPDLIIDAGRLPKRRVSTIVQVVDDRFEVLRKGTIKLK